MFDDDHANAGAWNVEVSIADDDLGYVHDGDYSSFCSARSHGNRSDAMVGSSLVYGVFSARKSSDGLWSCCKRRGAGAVVATLVLVLFAPRGLRHDPTCDGDGFRYAFLPISTTVVWLQTNGLLDGLDRWPRGRCWGATHVHLRNESDLGIEFYGFHDADCVAMWRESFQLD